MAPESISPSEADHDAADDDVIVPSDDVPSDDVPTKSEETGDEAKDEPTEEEKPASPTPTSPPKTVLVHNVVVPPTPLPPAPQESPQQRRLEDVRRVRDEAESLRHEICQLHIRMEEVEEESKFHAAKANELTELLMNSNSSSGNSGIDETILKQADELAKRSCQIEALDKKITDLITDKALLEIEKEKAKKETADLSAVVRSLQNVTRISMDKKNGDSDESGDEGGDDDDDDSEEEEEIILTPETALDLTLGNLKEHIELLEDGLQSSTTVNATQKKQIFDLENEKHINQLKIGMLEDLFRELNATDRISYESIEKEFKAKTAAINSDSDTTTEDKQPESESASKKEKNAPSSSSWAPSGIGSGLMGRFQNIGLGTFTGMISTEKQPEIPAQAAAAAKAAEIIVGSEGPRTPTRTNSGGTKGSARTPATPPNGNSPTPKNSGRKTTMKKVKIRFKKTGLEGTYTGPIVDRKPHGVGTIRFSNGDTYLGEMTRGKMSGTGTLYTKRKGVFRGQFENNQFVGEKQQEHEQDQQQQQQQEQQSVGSRSEKSNDGRSTPPAVEKADATPSTNTSVTGVSEEEDETARANAVAALELDGFSPTTITGTQDIMDGVDDMVVGCCSDSVNVTETAREENDAFLKELEGSDEEPESGDGPSTTGEESVLAEGPAGVMVQ